MSAAQLHEEQQTRPWLTRDGLVAAVSAIRKHRICDYRGGTRCDCKFGLKTKIVPIPVPSGAKTSSILPKTHEVLDIGSEQTGCPELYVVIDILSKMTKVEFDRLVRRPAKVVHVKKAKTRPCACTVGGVKRKDFGFVFKPKHPTAHPRRDADWVREICPLCKGSGKVPDRGGS